jgi:hypothetical protein
MVELYLHYPIGLHGCCLLALESSISTTTTATSISSSYSGGCGSTVIV